MRLTSILCAAILAVIFCSVCVFAGAPLGICLENMGEDTLAEVELEEQLTQAYEELRAAQAVVETYKWYNDDNRTEALVCMKDLTLCNTENEFKTEEADEPTRSVKVTDPLKGKKFTEDEKIRNKLASMERHLNKNKKNLKNFDKQRRSKSKRSETEFNLDQCERYRMESVARQNQLQESIVKVREQVDITQGFIVTYQRFSMLFDQIRRECLEARGLCRDGVRRLRLTFANAPDNGTFSDFFGEVTHVFVAFTPSEFTPTSAQLTAYAGGDESALTQAVEAAGGSAVPSGIVSLGEDGYWGKELEVDWEDAAYVYVVARSGSSVLVPTGPLNLFAANGNWIPSADTFNPRNAHRKRYDWPNLFGVTGEPVAFSTPHVAAVDLASVFEGSDNERPYATALFEEVRFVVEYPEGIPEVALKSL